VGNIIEDAPMARPARILVLWNQVEDDIYEQWKAEGPRALPWDPRRPVAEVGTVQEELDALAEAVRKNGHEAICINVRDDLDVLVAAVARHRPDAVMNLVEYFRDDEALEPAIAGLYELLGVAYTGGTPLCLASCQRKVRTKVMLQDAGLPTPAYFRADREPVPRPEDHGVRYPLIVKPAREDASGGIDRDSVVQTYQALVERCRYVFQEFRQPALVEEYVEGREIHAAILGNDPPEVLPLFEMEFDDSEFVHDDVWRPQIITYHAKWDPHSKAFYSMDAVCPAEDLAPKLRRRVKDVARRAFQVMECRDYARVDMRLGEDDTPYILEVNPNPDLAEGSAYIMCAEASGRSYTQTIGQIVRMALARRRGDEARAAGRPSSDHLLRQYRRAVTRRPPAKPEPKDQEPQP
jgi:D-alanine-D-alanine ligase